METCKINRAEFEDLNVREDFPMMSDDKVYLDSASTSFVPQFVLDSMHNYITTEHSNYNRGENDLVLNTTNRVNAVRGKVADFISATPEEIVFTSGATASSEIITNKIAINELSSGDEIMLCRLDHSSTIRPWETLQKTLKSFNVEVAIKEILIDLWGDYNEDDLIEKLSVRTKFVVLTHIHNVYGLEMGIKELSARIRAKNPNAKIVLDASQSMGHIPVSVKELDVDYLYFSGHKMFAITGIGVLYVKDKKYQDYEVGTPNILGIVGLGSAIDYINNIGIERVENYIFHLTRYLYEQLLTIDGIEFNKGIDTCKCILGYGIVTFKHNRISSEEINDILNYYKIFVRSNNFCQEGQDTYIRISLNIYNNKRDIDKLIKVLRTINE